MKIIRATVGRREKDNTLRPLNAEELAAVPGPVINVPLEAGFDLEPAANGVTPVEQLKDIRLSDWESAKLDHTAIAQSQKSGHARFRNSVKQYVAELEKHIPEKANVIFAHLMAGGVPRAKIVMPLMNRAFKGTGDRYLESEKFWQSDIGQLCALSFSEVTANTFDILIQETTQLRDRLQANGCKVAYSAYGYHGTEVLIGHNYLWQTYSPYLQGWAKMQLENYSKTWAERGVSTCVYNCPEILTNSSSIFQGVEVSLYPLLAALDKEGVESMKTKAFLKECQDLLKPEHTMEEVYKFTQSYLTNHLIREHCSFEKWPQHSTRDQMEFMLNSSNHLIDMHKSDRVLLTSVLSEVVFTGCGKVMLNDLAQPESPVAWINHDILAKTYAE